MNHKSNFLFIAPLVFGLSALLAGCETHVGVIRSAPIEGKVDGDCIRESLEYLGGLTHIEHRVRVTSPHPPERADGHSDLLLYTSRGLAVYLVLTRAHGEGVRYSSEFVAERTDIAEFEASRLRSLMEQVERTMQEACDVDFSAPIAEECIGFRCPE